LRSVRVRRLRPARPVQAPQDRADEGQQPACAGPGAAARTAGSVSAGIVVDGGNVGKRQRSLRAGADAREGHLPGATRQLPRSKLRRRHRHYRLRDQAQGTGAGRLGRLGRTNKHAQPAAGSASTREQQMIAYSDTRRMIGIRRAWSAVVVALCSLVVSAHAFAQASNAIEQVSVTRGASGRTVVKFTLKAPPANPPAGFAIANPPRIALDFPDTSSALPSNQRPVDSPTLRSLNFVQAGNRTRVVFNLNTPQTFETTVEGRDVLVTLADTGAVPADQAASVQRFAEPRPGDVTHALRDGGFRRGSNGEGRVVVELSE